MVTVDVYFERYSCLNKEQKCKMDKIAIPGAIQYLLFKKINTTEILRLHIEKIARIIGISNKGIHNILHIELGIFRVTARWMPHLLNSDKNVKEHELPTTI